MRYLVRNTEVYRVDTLEEVEKLKDEFENSQWFSVSSFAYAYKYIKKTDEEYYLVTVKKEITDEKEPERYIKVSYEVDA